MNSETCSNLELAATSTLFRNKHRFMTVKDAVDERLTEMVNTGEVSILTDEEERMLRGFRRFKAQASQDGEIFKWQAQLISDPQEVT